MSYAFVVDPRSRARHANEKTRPRGMHHPQGKAVRVRPQLEAEDRALRLLPQKVSFTPGHPYDLTLLMFFLYSN